MSDTHVPTSHRPLGRAGHAETAHGGWGSGTFTIWNVFASFFLIVLDGSPSKKTSTGRRPAIPKVMNANAPGFGGWSVMDECVATAETLSWNVAPVRQLDPGYLHRPVRARPFR